MTIETPEISDTGGRGWAYLGAVLGASISVCANVAEVCYVRTPTPGSIIAAIFWPVSLFVAIEIFARTFTRRQWWTVIRWTGLLPVALIAGIVSYLHMHDLLRLYGEHPIVYVIGPLAVDGLMVIATGGLIATAPPGRLAIERPMSVSKSDRFTERLEALKIAHRQAGRDWKIDKIGYREIEQYLGIKGSQTKSDLYRALYPPSEVSS